MRHFCYQLLTMRVTRAKTYRQVAAAARRQRSQTIRGRSSSARVRPVNRIVGDHVAGSVVRRVICHRDYLKGNVQMSFSKESVSTHTRHTYRIWDEGVDHCHSRVSLVRQENFNQNSRSRKG